MTSEAADDGGQAHWRAACDESAHGIRIEVRADHVGEDVVAAFPDGGEAHVRRGGEVPVGAGGQVAQEGAPEAVVLEDAVPGGAADAACLASVEEGSAAFCGDGPVVDLVTGDGLAVPARLSTSSVISRASIW
jgi:hypothetical protein